MVAVSFILANMPQIELKLKYKYRLILDESVSFGSVGRTGRGLTELYNVPVRSYCASLSQ
jgi:serine palmitoyltransferase